MLLRMHKNKRKLTLFYETLTHFNLLIVDDIKLFNVTFTWHHFTSCDVMESGCISAKYNLCEQTKAVTIPMQKRFETQKQDLSTGETIGINQSVEEVGLWRSRKKKPPWKRVIAEFSCSYYREAFDAGAPAGHFCN